MKDKLQVIQFDEEQRARDSLCCVCLGEFVLKEELRRLPLCKHVFHGDCIRLWLRTNATCPLCRCTVIPALKMGRPVGLGPDHITQGNDNPGPQHEQVNDGSSSSVVLNNSRPREHVVQIGEEPSSNSSNTS
ncbi:hypothetical protein SOVF_120620 [Spinacia oleracea]|nr:hypothetical protein SOVF_120620 [Spinacia oleracea]